MSCDRRVSPGGCNSIVLTMGFTMPSMTFIGCKKSFPLAPLALPALCHYHHLQRVTTTCPVSGKEESGSQAHPLPLDMFKWQPLQLSGDMNGPTAFPLN
jgi:hypothetical protein